MTPAAEQNPATTRPAQDVGTTRPAQDVGPTRPARDVGRYLHAARELEDALRHNKADFEFTGETRQGEIVYIVDTNVVVHYLEESRRIKQGEFSFGDFLNEGVPARVNDQLTIEYLLSGRLPGQNGRSLYLTPWHWNEIMDRATETVRKLDNLLQALPKARVQALAALQDPAKKIEMARKFLPDWILEALKIAPAVRRRLRAAFRDEPAKLQALDHLPDYWSDALSRLRASDVREWRARVLAATPASRTAKAGHANSRNLDNDVQSLALIHALYRENPEACRDTRNVQFLFVTADRSLYRAVEDHADALEREGIPMFARHPRVFSPLLNFSAMSRARTAEPGGAVTPLPVGSDLRRVFAEVESTLQRLLVFDAPGVTAYGRTRRWHQAREEIEQTLESWSAAARQLALAQSHFFLFLESDAIREAVSLLESPQALEATRKELIETIESIRDRHVRFQSLEALRRLADTMRRRRRGKRGRRAPLQVIGVDVLQPIRAVLPSELATGRLSNLHDLLDYLALPGADPKLLESIGTALLDNWQDPLAQLLAACLYLAAEAWASARDCAQRCRDAPGIAPSLWREADYCFALASRFMLESRDVYKTANERLFDHQLRITTDRTLHGRLARLRYQVEHGALRGAAATLQAIDDATPFSNEFGPDNRIMSLDSVRNTFDTAHTLEAGARETLHDDFSGPLADRDAARMIQTLRLQLYTNIVGTEIFRHSLGKRVSDDPYRPDRLRAALGELEDDCPGPRPQIVAIYVAVSYAILDQTPPALAKAAALLKRALDDPSLSYCDQVEYGHLRDHLQLMHNELVQTA